MKWGESPEDFPRTLGWVFVWRQRFGEVLRFWLPRFGPDRLVRKRSIPCLSSSMEMSRRMPRMIFLYFIVRSFWFFCLGFGLWLRHGQAFCDQFVGQGCHRDSPTLGLMVETGDQRPCDAWAVVAECAHFFLSENLETNSPL